MRRHTRTAECQLIVDILREPLAEASQEDEEPAFARGFGAARWGSEGASASLPLQRLLRGGSGRSQPGYAELERINRSGVVPGYKEQLTGKMI